MRIDPSAGWDGAGKSLNSDTDSHEPTAGRVGAGCRRLDFLKTGLDQRFLNLTLDKDRIWGEDLISNSIGAKTGLLWIRKSEHQGTHQ